MKKKIAVSIGDLNGIGIELALRNHKYISKMVEPIYCIGEEMAEQAAGLLDMEIPVDFFCIEPVSETFEIKPGKVDTASGEYSFASFVTAVELARENKVDGIVTLPIHKKAWELAGIKYKGHTDALRDFFDAEAIMMLGSAKMFVALFTEHIPLKDVAVSIKEDKLTGFLIDFHHSIQSSKSEIRSSKIAVLGLNPHAGDNGVLGDEERIIEKAIKNANDEAGKNIFTGPLVPDIAFIPQIRKQYNYYIAMYHDQGLAPLKALYFDEGINVSLNLPIIRTSVDHGTAFDIAYTGSELNNLSYINAVKYIG